MEISVPEDEFSRLKWFKQIYKIVEDVYDPFFEVYKFPFFYDYKEKIKKISEDGVSLCEQEINKYITSSGIISEEFNNKNKSLINILSKIHKGIASHEKLIFNFLKNGKTLNELCHRYPFSFYISLN